MDTKQPDDEAMINPEGFFLEGGRDYAAYRPGYPPSLAEAFAALAPARELAVDVGCGNGQLAVLLAAHFDQVVATDVSASQLAHAAEHPKVAYRCEAAEQTSVERASADLIVAAQAAHWFDLTRFYADVRRIARADAVLALVSYGVPCLEEPVDAPFQRFYWHGLAGCWPPERVHVETGYARLPFPFAELAPPALHIRRDWNLEQLMGYIRTWSAVRRLIACDRGRDLERFESELAAAWGVPTAARAITWPIAIRLGRIRAEDAIP